MSVASKGRILVVDDNRLVLATLADGLSQAGYEVIDADNGDDAILLAREHRPDLALLDIRMEGKSGFDVAAYLRSQCQMPFMFLSAFSDDETVAQVKALGAVAYLVKPLDIRQIVPTVEAAFANIEAGRRAAASPPPRSPQGDSRESSLSSSPASSLESSLASSMAPSWAATPAHLQPHRGNASNDPLDASTAMAVGVLMHRYSLTRVAARDRLRRLAEAERRPLSEQAERLLDAVECLSATGSE